MVIDDENIPVITSEYIDNAAIKKMVTESLIDKYFPEIISEILVWLVMLLN